ncbi:unnamed protein product [Cylicocyclus nassatus]|uniref:CHK kinase-like domain-containing protein n=1 Tax=Cylicocyclus nassatus TaxID=53992 RepID=A0AA36DLY7_CYLNA|nr:unnamed protein product [Cylicocyclus nassatus]
MNLHTPGNGLFETHVTWKDIEQDMQRELHTKASFGPGKSAKNLAEGIGYLSKMVLIDPDWQNADKELPRRFVVKILTQMMMANLTAEMGATGDFESGYSESYKKAHNVEVLVYNYLLKHAHARVLLPKIYYMRSFTECNPLKGYIIMEYLENVKVDFCNNFSIKSVKEVFPTVAVMEAMSLKFILEERNQFTTTFYQQFYAKMCEDNVFVKSIEMLRKLGDGRFNKKVDKLEVCAKYVLDPVKVDRLADDLGMQRVLCHGDLWTANVLWVNGNNDLKASAVIDFQCAHMGCAAVDIASMFLSCLSGKDRQEHWTDLLEHFYSTLQEEVGTMKMPYTFEQLRESYCQCLPFIGFTFLPFMIPFLDKMLKEVNVAQNEEKLESLMEKMEYILDDIVFFYELNKEKNLQAITASAVPYSSTKLRK